MSPDSDRRIYMSYARRDRDRAHALAQRLRGEPGLRVFAVEQDVTVGDDVAQPVRSALREADVVVAYVTRAYLESDWTGAEVGAAWMLGKPIIAIVEDPRLLERLPEGLSMRQMVALEPNAEDWVVESLNAT